MTFAEVLAETGHEQKTTFWSDFSIADKFGVEAIKDTYNRASKEWITNVEYFAELVLVLNWKCWNWYQKNDDFSALYSELYYAARDLAYDTFKDEDLEYLYDYLD